MAQTDSSAVAGFAPALTTNAKLPIPWLVKRNTVLFAAAQAFIGVGTQLVPTLGAIMVVHLLGSASLAGLATSIQGLSRVLVAYPIGKLTDAFGRKAGLMVGLAISLAGAIGVGLSISASSFPLFVAGIVVFGLGIGAGQQLRLGAADMYPPDRRAEGLGIVLTGTIAGSFGAPLLISSAQSWAPQLSVDPIALAWFLVPLVIIPSLLIVLQIHPDPKEIAAHLERYYPGYTPPAPTTAARQDDGSTSMLTLARSFPNRVALVSSFASQGNMSMVMAMTSLALAQHHYELPSISLVVSLHVFGMFGMSLPVGRLADRIGRRYTLLIGSVIAGLGAVLVPSSQEYWIITLGTVLVGLGWCCTNVATTALLVDCTNPLQRGRAVGLNDTFGAAASFFLPMLAGPLVQLLGLGAIGYIGMGIMIPPIVFQALLKETSPGQYAHP